MTSDATYEVRSNYGGVSIGIIMHGDSAWNGHGPGCQDLLVCAGGEIEPVIEAGANLANILNIRTA